MSTKPRDSDSVGICSRGIDITDLKQKYYEEPIDSLQTKPQSAQTQAGNPKIFPYVNNRHLSKTMNLLGKYDDLGHAQTYFNPARDALYARYSTGDWHFSNQSNYQLSASERNAAEKVRANATWSINETDARTNNRQNQVTSRLKERVEDITFWSNELSDETRAMKQEIDNLEEHKSLAENVWKEARKPIDVAQECLREREKRTGIDLVKDDVERALNKEVAVGKKCRERINKTIEKANVQLKLNTSALHTLEVDNQHKTHAQKVDNSMRKLTNSSTGIGYHPGIEYFDNTITVPISWVKYTQTNIKRSQKERDSSERIRNDIDECLRNCLNAMWNQFNQSNNALAARVRETTDARNKLLAHLKRTMEEIADMERNIEKLRQAIRDKEAPMKVAQTRLDERSRRINVELCNDPVMKTLLKEVDEIRESVRILKARLKPSDLSLARLLKAMTCLKHDIGVKENSLQIDSETCLGMRAKFPMSTNLNALDTMPLPT